MQGPLLLLVISATLALLLLLIILGLHVAQRRWSDAAWAAAPLLGAGITALLRGWSILHLCGALLTAGLIARNSVVGRGTLRVVHWAALLSWILALVAARMLFHP